MLKTVRKLRKKREEEKLRLQTQKKSNFEVARGFFAKILTGAT
jgi:hypothetical protein